MFKGCYGTEAEERERDFEGSDDGPLPTMITIPTDLYDALWECYEKLKDVEVRSDGLPWGYKGTDPTPALNRIKALLPLCTGDSGK